MRKLEYLRLAAAAAVVLACSGQALGADYPSGVLVGVDVAAGIPLSDFQTSADVGGVVAPFIGYRLRGRAYALTPMVRTQFAFLPARDQNVRFAPGTGPSAGGNRQITQIIHESDVQTLFAGTGGFRASIIDGSREIYFGALGGYYTDMGSGPVRDDGPGYTLEAGINLGIAGNTALGIFIRRDEAFMKPNLLPEDRDESLQYLTVGLSLSQLFPVVANAPPPPPPPPAPVAKAEVPPVTKKIVLRGVTFAFDSAVLSDDATPILDEAARVLKDAGDVEISIEGHTDAVGSEEYNLGLSRRRAASVSEYLQGQGIDAARLATAGFGEEQPVASNDTKDGRAQNRRVELRVAQD